jgi:hypothetical protein
MNWLRKVEARQTPPGAEMRILKRLPRITLAGTLLVLALPVLVRILRDRLRHRPHHEGACLRSRLHAGRAFGSTQTSSPLRGRSAAIKKAGQMPGLTSHLNLEGGKGLRLF